MRSLLLAVVLFSNTVYADRITEMLPMEECVYRARLAAAGSWVRIQKHAVDCATIKYILHGNETEYEIAYAKEWTCEGFNLNLDPLKTGDKVYLECMKTK